MASATPMRGARYAGRELMRGADDAGLSAVELLQAVEAHVCGAEVRFLDAIPDGLEGGEHAPERPAVGWFVRVYDGGFGLPGQGLPESHAGKDAPCGRQRVNDQGPAAGAVYDDGGGLCQVRLSLDLHPGPQVGDEYAGDPQAPSCASWCGDTGDGG